MDLINEFHADHQHVVAALFELRQAIAERNVPGVRQILGAAEGLVGPHFKFEELYLYPALEPFLGEAYGKRLLNEHDGIFRSIRKIAQLSQSDSWDDAQYQSAMANLELIYEHPISCDGLSLWIERLPESRREGLLQKMLDTRKQGTRLSEYYRERQTA